MSSESWQLPQYVLAGEVVYPPGGIYGPRIQLDYQLVLLHTGSLRLELDNEQLHFQAGVVLLLTPGHREFYQFTFDSPTHHSWISVRCPTLPESWLNLIPTIQKAIPLSHRMTSLAQEAIFWVRRGNAQQLLHSIGYHALGLYFQEACETTQALERKHEAVYLTEQYIRQWYSKDICLDDLSKQATVSAEYLCRLFQTQCGTSPIAYLWDFRTRRALDLLTATGLPVADIAARCGFKTPYHLHRKVKALTGLSPTQYRSRSWSDAQFEAP